MFVGLPNALPLPVSCHLLKGGPERTYVVTQVNVLYGREYVTFTLPSFLYGTLKVRVVEVEIVCDLV